MSTEPTIRRAWQWFLVSAALAAALFPASSPAQTSAAKDLEIVQGLWERQEPSDSQASYRRATKDIQGNKETVSYYDARGALVRRHKVDFTLSRMGDVKVFTYTQMEVTDGPQKGSKFPGPVSYVYWANDRYFREAWGFLPGQEAPPAVLYVWKRSGGAGEERQQAGLAAATEKAAAGSMSLAGRWRPVSNERADGREPQEQTERHRLVFTTDTFRVERDGQLFIRGRYTVDASKQPATIDMTVEEHAENANEAGKVVRGIVEQSGEELKWCISRPDEERPTAFAPKEGSEQMLIVLKREKD
jgi:uncharacterized protein (TIGR03067 family)